MRKSEMTASELAPDPPFKYFSNARALLSDLNATAVSIRHGRCLEVRGHAPGCVPGGVDRGRALRRCSEWFCFADSPKHKRRRTRAFAGLPSRGLWRS